MASLSFCSAHSETGPHDVQYIEHQGKVHMVTCGGDGKLCFRSATNPAETTKVIDVRGGSDSSLALTCLAISPAGDRVVVGDDQNFVKVFSFPDGELDHVATRFTLPPRSLVYSAAGSTLASAGDDEGVKLMDTAANKVFRSLKSPPYTLGLAYDPEGKYVASVCGAGSLTVWDIATGKAETTIKSLFPKGACAPKNRTLPAWHPDGGSLLAVPGASGAIHVYERLSWDAAYALEAHTDHVTLLAYSKNGLYLASASADGAVIVWDVTERTVLKKRLLPAPATGLAWHPGRGTNDLAVMTEDGELAVWGGVVPGELPAPGADIDAMTGVKKRGQREGASMIDGEAGDGGDDHEGEESDDEYDREDSFLAASPRGGTQKIRRRSKGGRAMRFDAVTVPGMDLPEPQPAIQSGSTKLDSGRRYLAYTRVGCITARTEGDHNVIDVAFHDTARAKRRVPLLSDFFGFSLGALGEKGALYASRAATDAPATILYRPFDSWAPNSDWSFGLPGGEGPVCLAAGLAFCAVATTKRRLRVFSLAGLQWHVLDLAGDAVATAAQGHLLAVAWHGGQPSAAGDQVIHYAVYDVTEGQQVQSGPLPLSPGATLTWFGFTEEGALASYDSEGEVRVRTPAFGGAWVPVFTAANERKGAEHFWVFSVSAAEVQCIVCAGRAEPTVPSGSARPVVSAPPLRVPVLAQDEGVAPLEADLLRHQLALAHVAAGHAAAEATGDADTVEAAEASLHGAQVDADRAGLRLFTKLVQGDRQARAVEVAVLLQTEAALTGALKIAHHHRLSALAERVGMVIEQRAAAEAAVVEQEYGLPQAVVAVEEQVVEEEEVEEELHDQGDEVRGGSEVEAVPAKTVSVGAKLSVLKENAGKNGSVDGVVKRKAPAGNPFARKKTVK